MYYAPVRATGIGQQYRSVDVSSKVEGASPHRLVAILYEELIQSMALMKQAVRKGDAARRNGAASRATMLVQALEASLDYDKGGDIARALRTVYGETRRLLGVARADNDADAIGRAQAIVGEIAEAWTAIG